MKRNQRAFTLVEVLAVLAVFSILAFMALPGLSTRTIQQQVKTAMSMADVAKPPFVTAWAASAAFPTDNVSAGIPVADKIVSNYVKSVSIEGGAIHLVFGNQVNATIAGKTLSFRPAVVADEHQVPITWVCGNASAPDKMVAMGANKTDLPDNLLPVVCRSDGKK